MNARFLGLFSDNPGLDFRVYFEQLGTEFSGLFSNNPYLIYGLFSNNPKLNFLGLFWAVPRLILGLLLVHVCHLSVIAKMNNILVV